MKPSHSIVIKFSLLLILFSCKPPAKKEDFKKDGKGFWFRLITFDDNGLKNHYKGSSIAWVSASFKTQDDSVFYETENDLKDRFFVRTDSLQSQNLLKYVISRAEKGDSLCVLIKPLLFFEQQFKSQIPLFCKNDSVVKVYMKIKNILSDSEYSILTKKITNTELSEIESFFGSPQKFEQARDPLGFYWVEKPADTTSSPVEAGKTISVNYSGGFLNGRIIDVSPGNFQVVYGTPDQLLKGLNYVISKLKMGQTSKIILPSHLAFGESGSSNGSVPPFTPMLYKISISN